MANPSIAPFSHTSDGQIINTNASWSTLRAATTGTVQNGGTAMQCRAYEDTGTYGLRRVFMAFDTSSIPDGAEVVSAVLSVYVTAKSGTSPWCLVESTAASGTALDAADFDNVGSTELATRKTQASITTSAYNTFTLNASGLAAISKTGYTKLAFRIGYDLDNSAPGTAADSDVTVSSADASGTSQDPYLTVTYSLDRSTSDSWAWTDRIVHGSATGGAVPRVSDDQWAWSDSAAPYSRVSRQPVVVRAAGANTVTSGSHTLSTGTITVSSTTGFATSGTAYIATTDFATTSSFTYTGVTSTTFTGCSGGSGTFASGSMVAAADAESHFPQVTLLDDTDTPAILVSYQQKPMHGHPSVNKLCAKKSVKGGVDFASLTEYTILSAPVNSGYGIGAHMMARLKNGRLLMIWYEGNGSLGYVKAYMSYTDSDPLVEANWSTPVRLTSPYHADYCATGSQYILYEGAGSNSTYGDLYVTTYGRYSLPSGSLSARMAKITDGGAGGTWTDVSLIADYAGSGSTTQFTEVGLVALDTGTWLAHIRGEDDLDRWQATSTDQGATWGSLTKVIVDLANQPALVQMPEGHVISQGTNLDAGRGTYGRTITFISTDRGTTWPSTASHYRLEETDATYTLYNGSDIDIADSTIVPLRRVVNAYAQEKTTQAGAQVKFQWYAIENMPIASDSWAWSDSAAGRISAAFKTAADSWAWSDVASKTQAFSRVSRANFFSGIDTETWTWTDSAVGVSPVTNPRSTGDIWAWLDAASQIHSLHKTTADTWAWSDTATYVLTPVASFWIRSASDSWAWTDSAFGAVALYAPNQTSVAKWRIQGRGSRRRLRQIGP